MTAPTPEPNPFSAVKVWFEYLLAGRKAYRMARPVDANADPMLAATYGWFSKIDAATTNALAEGYIYFSCGLTTDNRRIVLEFWSDDARRRQRSLRVDSRFQRPNGPPLYDDVLDLKIALQTRIYECAVKRRCFPAGANPVRQERSSR